METKLCGGKQEVKTRTPDKSESGTRTTQGREVTAPRRRADRGGERKDHYPEVDAQR